MTNDDVRTYTPTDTNKHTHLTFFFPELFRKICTVSKIQKMVLGDFPSKKQIHPKLKFLISN